MGFIGYPKVKLLVRNPSPYKSFINTFSVVAPQAREALSKKPALEDMLGEEEETENGENETKEKDFNFFHFDSLIGSNGAVMLPPIYDEENTLLTMDYKVNTGQPIREIAESDYSKKDIAEGNIPDNIDELIGVDPGERYQPYNGVLDGIDYSLSSQAWEEIWAIREKKEEEEEEEGEEEEEEEEEGEEGRSDPPGFLPIEVESVVENSSRKPPGNQVFAINAEENNNSSHYIDDYKVKVHQDQIRENISADDPVINPPENTKPDLHFCIKRQKPYPPMPTGINEDGEVEGLQVFWTQITKGPASFSEQSKSEEKEYPDDENYESSDWDRADLVTERPFVSVGFGSGANNKRIEIVFPSGDMPYAVIWYQEEGSDRRDKNIKYPLQNARPVMASSFNVFVYVMLGEIAIRVLNGDMTNVIWEDKIVDRSQEDDDKRYIKVLSGAPYVRGKNMQCTVGMSRLKFEKNAVGYTPKIKTHIEADEGDIDYILHGAYDRHFMFPSESDETGKFYYINVEDWEPTPDKATGDTKTTFSFVPNTYIGSYIRWEAHGKFKDFYWMIVLERETNNEYITPLLFSVEATGPPVIQEIPEWVEITDLLIDADISQSAPDWHTIDQYLTLQLRDDNFISSYDEFGQPIYENCYDYFSEGAREIQLQVGWHTDNPDPDQPSSIDDLPDLTPIFTGFVSNVNLDYIAELDIVSLKISHMIERMKNIPIVLSPYYDGMETGEVIKDLVRRGQLIKANSEPNVKLIEDDVIVEQFNKTVFYLGIGKDYQSPVAKFGGEQMIMECIKDVAKDDGARVYGHPDGSLVYYKNSYGVVDDGTPVATFYTYPSTGSSSHSEYYTIFDGLNFERTPHAAFNQIQIITIERDLRKPIVENIPKLDENGEIDTTFVGYLKPALFHIPKLGDLKSARISARNHAKVVFYPPKKASFDALGHPELLPIDCIEVQTTQGTLGRFRIVSISSKISKNDNEFTYEASYDLEWQGTVQKRYSEEEPEDDNGL